MQINKAELDFLITEGLVRSVRHSTLPITVYNYTATAQFKKAFKDYPLLLQCRGLVLDDDYIIVGRGFAKFFNYEEHGAEEMPIGTSKVEVTEKVDGSLLIVFRYAGQVVYTTRGSFYSDQAVAGSNLFKSLYNEDLIQEGYSYLFEYVGPDNRIVVCYDQPMLIHLAVINNSTGREGERDSRFNCVTVHNVDGGVFGDELFRALSSMNIQNKEGFVVRYVGEGWYGKSVISPDWRCKIKFEDYVKLHRIVTGVSNKSLWECLKDGLDIGQYLENVPDEFYKWANGVKADLEDKFFRIERDATYAFSHAVLIETRKEQAIYLQTNHKDVMHIVFKMLDGQDYKENIWKQLKPEKYDQPFSNRAES